MSILKFSPYSGVSTRHALFKIESRRVQRLLDSQQLFQSTLTIIAVIFIIALFFWMLVYLSEPDPRYNYRQGLNQYAALLLFISFAADAFLDFASMVASMGSISGEFTAGRWDLLRLTPLLAEEITAVKHAAARVRVWRMTMVVLGLRVTTVVLGLLTMIVSGQISDLRITSLDQFILLMTILFVAATYVVEPIWRARAFTAVGLAISMRLRSGLSLTLSAIGAVLALWILQPIAMGFVFWTGGSLVGSLIFTVNNPVLGTFLLLLVCLFIAAVFYGFYAAVRQFAFDNLNKWVDRIES